MAGFDNIPLYSGAFFPQEYKTHRTWPKWDLHVPSKQCPVAFSCFGFTGVCLAKWQKIIPLIGL